MKERLADEFTRLDFMEAAERGTFSVFFRKALEALVKLDKSFDRKSVRYEGEGRFLAGRDIFASQPACVGFVTAIAIKVFGRPGTTRGDEEQNKSMSQVMLVIEKFCSEIDKIPDAQFIDFLSLEILNDSLPKSRGTSSIGNSEREYFLKAFQTLFDDGSHIDNLEPCWRAY
ncbi:MAG: hypothetical protein EON50_08280 [Acidovorax sp.]|nr:MAG: hypothetical protein EON50_08280 [Acidovorax sp.]